LFVYLICLPLAVFLGYMLANPLDVSTFATVGLLLFVLMIPLLLRFHYPLMIVAWNSSAVVFFLPGRPQLWLAAIALSFAISIAHRTMDKRFHFISVRSVAWPLFALALIVIITARATGGIGLRSLGGDVFGGRRYVQLLCGIVGFFAITAYRIPRDRVGLYVGLFFLGGITSVVGDLYMYSGPLTKPLFLLFPPNGTIGLELGSTRFLGLTGLSSGFFSFMLAKYGITGIFSAGRLARLAFFLGFSLLGFFSGFRSLIISFVLVFTLQFFLEGLHRTRLLPTLSLAVILLSAITLPFLQHFPITFQRALAFLPVPMDPVAQSDAEGSSEWRLRIWKAVLPQVPRYLLLGKGYAMSQEDYSLAAEQTRAGFEEQSGAALAGDYHNGPLSVIIPFGIWGAAAFLWFLIASLRVLYRNYKFGDPALRTFNTLLLTTFAARAIMFFLVAGGLYSDILQFAAWVGLSVSINSGVAKPAFELVPASRQLPTFAGVLPRPRSALGR
jgi:hypothetical protein